MNGRRARARARATVVITAATAAALAVLAGCSGGNGGTASDSDNAGSNDRLRYAAGSRTETYAEAPRSLVTTLFYPAKSIGEGAAPVTVGGPFPLILFSHGGGTTGTSYSNLLSRIVEAGYVVAAPNYPPGGDAASRAADARFVLSGVLADAGQTAHPLHGLIDTARVGAMGHSAGGGVTLGFAFHSCCRDDRIKAAVLLASARPAYPGGESFPLPAVPALVVHGDADSRAPYADGRQLYDEMRTPKYFLTVRGGEHTPPFSGEVQRPDARLVVEATVAFLDQYLKGGAEGTGRLRRIAAAEPDLASLDAAP